MTTDAIYKIYQLPDDSYTTTPNRKGAEEVLHPTEDLRKAAAWAIHSGEVVFSGALPDPLDVLILTDDEATKRAGEVVPRILPYISSKLIKKHTRFPEEVVSALQDLREEGHDALRAQIDYCASWDELIADCIETYGRRGLIEEEDDFGIEETAGASDWDEVDGFFFYEI